MNPTRAGLWLAALAIASSGAAQAAAGRITPDQIDAAAKAVEPKTIEWRRDFHAHPELSNRETRTAEQIAKRLRALGMVALLMFAAFSLRFYLRTLIEMPEPQRRDTIDRKSVV